MAVDRYLAVISHNSVPKTRDNIFFPCGECYQLVVYFNFARTVKQSFASKYFKFLFLTRNLASLRSASFREI